MNFNFDPNSSNFDSLDPETLRENGVLDNTKKAKSLLSLIMVLPSLGFGILIIGFTILSNVLMDHQSKSCTAEAEGIVIEYKTWVTKDSETNTTSTSYAPIVRFTAENGKEYESASTSYTSFSVVGKKYPIGSKQKLLYDPDDPENIVLPDQRKDSKKFDIIFVIPGIIMIISAIVILRKAKKQKALYGNDFISFR